MVHLSEEASNEEIKIGTFFSDMKKNLDKFNSIDAK